MARETPKAALDDSNEKPLPEPNNRPGTSGTEALLVTNRRRASEKYQQAQRAERTYKAKKRSAAARANYVEAKTHFKESARHFKAGMSMTLSVVKCVPYMFSEKSAERKRIADEKKRKRAMEKKKKWEEALAKEAADAEGEERKKSEDGEAAN
ncbi:hypothetical protein UCRPA7_6838 [Phaeoacremonium minimum UCRPA7]|uniref:Uncharacterized protein n=1 Tax=Phaeoacremonium minimum (strain UCR-PA7) TaxID=1286976 RepID=R8BEH4_PHAM7|nr:hypothetical protein UCRPA7_6838 [Phaeoacremonium minimum UCRPA7]EON97685.1 hypothetical protein UCRPA7_6838 [Phaeoacremonium minimum UCRPA7]